MDTVMKRNPLHHQRGPQEIDLDESSTVVHPRLSRAEDLRLEIPWLPLALPTWPCFAQEGSATSVMATLQMTKPSLC
jgi:hypothetical protein